MDSSGNVGWYLKDHLGSVRDMVDGTGTLKDHLDFDGWGNITTETHSSFGDRYKYTSREWDAEIGLQYNRARWYDPATGRWISTPFYPHGYSDFIRTFMRTLPV